MKTFVILLACGLIISQTVMSLGILPSNSHPSHAATITKDKVQCHDDYQQAIAHRQHGYPVDSDSWTTAIKTFMKCRDDSTEGTTLLDQQLLAFSDPSYCDIAAFSKRIEQLEVLIKIGLHQTNRAMKRASKKVVDDLAKIQKPKDETLVLDTIDTLWDLINDAAKPTEDALRLATLEKQDIRGTPHLVQQAKTYLSMMDSLDDIEKDIMSADRLIGNSQEIIDKTQMMLSKHSDFANTDIPEPKSRKNDTTIFVSDSQGASLRDSETGSHQDGSERTLAEDVDFKREYLRNNCCKLEEYPWEHLLSGFELAEGGGLEILEGAELRVLVKSQFCD